MSALDKLTMDAEAELVRLAQPRKYSFNDIGEQIAASLLKAAEDQVVEAQNLRDSVIALAEGIRAQMKEHADLLNDMDSRMRAFGSEVIEAHKKYINGGKHGNPSP